MENVMCHECKKPTILKEDCLEGDLVCTECGLVLDSHFVDERQEWRTWELDLESQSQVRAEKSCDVLFQDAQLFTTIAKPQGALGSRKNFDIMGLEKKYHVPKHRLMEGFNVISTMGDKLALAENVSNRALEIFKMMKDLDSFHGQNNIVAISCLYTACQLEKNGRTLKEIVAVANDYVQMRAIFRTHKKVFRELLQSGYSVDKIQMTPTMNARRFCSHLEINNTDVKAILETIDNIKDKLDIRRTPNSIVAATISMITQLSTDKKNLARISKATGVGEKTISSTYNEISPFTSEIVPQWFQKQLISSK